MEKNTHLFDYTKASNPVRGSPHASTPLLHHRHLFETDAPSPTGPRDCFTSSTYTSLALLVHRDADGVHAAQTLPPYPIAVLDPNEHETGPSRVVPFDLSEHFGALIVPYGTDKRLSMLHRGASCLHSLVQLPNTASFLTVATFSCMHRQQYRSCVCSGAEEEATAPNLLCGFLHIQPGQSLRTEFVATSQAFFVIRHAPSFVRRSKIKRTHMHDVMTQPATHWRAPVGDVVSMPRSPLRSITKKHSAGEAARRHPVMARWRGSAATCLCFR